MVACNAHGERVVAMPGMVLPVRDERDGLLSYLDQQRGVLRIAAHGLTDEQARLAPTVSSLTIGGLIKHVAACERSWINTTLGRERDADPEAYADNFRMTEHETLDGVLQSYADAAKETEAAVADLDLDHPVPV